MELIPTCQHKRRRYVTFQPNICLYFQKPGPETHLRRFPFNKNYRFKFSEFSLVKWNASNRFPGFVVTSPATQGMLGDHCLILVRRKRTSETLSKSQNLIKQHGKTAGTELLTSESRR